MEAKRVMNGKYADLYIDGDLMAEALLAAGQSVHLIGGADVAAELDAKRAIDQGSRLAARL